MSENAADALHASKLVKILGRVTVRSVLKRCFQISALLLFLFANPVRAEIPPGSYQSTCTGISVSPDGTTLEATCKTTSGQSQFAFLQNFSLCKGDIANFDGTLACNIGGQPPSGSYTQTCRFPYVNTSTLFAECKTSSGQWQPTQLQNFNKCLQPPANLDGGLVCDMGVQPPSGSYSQSCRYAFVDGNTLLAECNTTSGQWNWTQLQNFSLCNGDIANFDGTLACNIGGQPPSGSYTQTCRYAYVNGTTLFAECKTMSGRWQWTELRNFNQCLQPPANLDGGLVCNMGVQPPSGSYSQSCRYTFVDGNTLLAECNTTSGQWNWTQLQNFSLCNGDIENIEGTLFCGHPVKMSDVPLRGAVVSGSAMIHEHIMAEHAFSGKWIWGSIDGPENVVMRVCDGSGDTHAGADLVCSVLGWAAWTFGFDGDKSLGFDTCCHSGGLFECNYKATNGYDPNEWWTRLDWPKWDTQAHPRYWVGDMQRALANGLKLIVAIAVENELLCSKVDTHVARNPFRGGYHCDHGDSYNSVSQQIKQIKAFAQKYSSTFQIAYTPGDARSIIKSGKMAVILGIEADYTWGNERHPIDYLARLNDYYNQGVRHIYLTHKLNGPLAGAAYPSESQIKILQALHNCWYLNVGCTGHSYAINSVCPSGDVTNYYQMCDSLAVALIAAHPDGFANYPGGGINTVTETNYHGDSYQITKNVTGLSAAGKAVVKAMMKKGMFIDISHLSEKSIDDVYAISQSNLNYPLSASHGLARAILLTTDEKIDGRRPTSATAEFALSDGSLARIATTEGVLGHFISPDPTVNYTPSGVRNDCQRSDKSLAQSLAYAIDKLNAYRIPAGGERVGVALAGDFMGQGLGVAPRLGFSDRNEDWCGGDVNQQQLNRIGPNPQDPHLSSYSTIDDKEGAQFATRGFAHPGLIKQLFFDLNRVGLSDRYRHPYEYEGAENIIRTWEKAVYISQKLP